MILETVRNALPTGRQLQEYRIDAVIGQGGFGITYLAHDTHLDKKVAIKEYLPLELAVRDRNSTVVARSSRIEDDFLWGMEQFLQEARTLARFHHPNIVQVLRFFEENGTAYIVMNYLAGESLASRLGARETLDEKEMLALVGPLLDGLEAIHDAGFLHRDIKPGNILITTDGTPVLLDFGAARRALQGKSRSLTSIVSRGFAPFEQYQTRTRQGPFTDIYAMAAVMYRMLTGTDPVEATERVHDDPLMPAARAARGKASPSVLTAIDRGIAVKPEDRPQTIAQWRVELGLNGVASLPLPTARMISPRRTEGAEATSGEAAPVARESATQDNDVSPPSSGERRPRWRPAGWATSTGARLRPLLADRWPAITAASVGVAVVLVLAWMLLLQPAETAESLGGFDQNVDHHGLFDLASGDVPEMLAALPPAPRGGSPQPTAKPDPSRAALLRDAELKDMLAGASLTFRRDPGGLRVLSHWSLNPDGSLRGTNTEERMAGAESYDDRGTWWIQSSELCLRWNQWEGGKTVCYEIQLDGPVHVAKGDGHLSGPFTLQPPR